jgi:CRP-like cAMP-binding protein
VQGVPLIQSVPRGERIAMISQAQIREFREGEYIIKQGEVGEELFIILEGACDVVEDKNLVKSSSKDDKDKDKLSMKEKEKDKDGKDIEKVPNIVKLVTLREGHFFGEMSLMTVGATHTTLSVCLPACLPA